MPIRPENRHRYPADWKQIRAAILERAKDCCERCGVPNHAVGYRDRETGAFIPNCGNGPCDASGRGLDWPSLNPLSYAEARQFVEVYHCCTTPSGKGCDDDGNRWIVIVLTIAHLDHQPENCDPSNLRALCQRCHNRHDAKARAQGIKTRRESPQLTLPL